MVAIARKVNHGKNNLHEIKLTIFFFSVDSCSFPESVDFVQADDNVRSSEMDNNLQDLFDSVAKSQEQVDDRETQDAIVYCETMSQIL